MGFPGKEEVMSFEVVCCNVGLYASCYPIGLQQLHGIGHCHCYW